MLGYFFKPRAGLLLFLTQVLGYFFWTQMLGSAFWVILLAYFNAGLLFRGIKGLFTFHFIYKIFNVL